MNAFGQSVLRTAAALAVATMAVAWSLPAHAETIAGALAKAYSGNPQLKAEEARQRATDERVPQAKSGWRPQVEAQAGVTRNWQGSRLNGAPVTSERDFTNRNFTITLNQPVFDGFRTENAVREAEAAVAAGNQNLLAVEQEVLLNAATAYMNVLRDREIIGYRQRSLEFFDEEVRASQARFNVGEITRTDVAQARARASEARGNLAVAVGNLESSVANYIRVIGETPGKLKYPGLSPRVPKTLRDAIDIASQTNPQILAAAYNEEAAIANIGVRKADLLPQLGFQAQYSTAAEPSSTIDDSESASIGGVLSIPIYDGGSTYSRIREAKQTASQRRLQVLDANRQVRESVVRAWHLLKAATATIKAAEDAVAAQRIALEGVREEARVGTRTTLDVLNAANELVFASIALANAKRDRIVAGYQLVASTGRMTADDLRLSVSLYDPSVNYDDVRDKAFGARILDQD
ncbi:MAG: TolC family outer membrane protein [Anderseniella sp.]|jgi:TolC family type I secretion outer membrane protein|nr:TolC family outer membrane protein [Anderseniella sp.]